MISGSFKYSVLQYVPSQVRNERVNVGLIVFFHEIGQIRFIYPKSLSRLKSLFRNIQESKIRQYLSQIEKNITSLNKRDLLFFNDFKCSDELSVFLDEEVFKADDSALQFSPVYESLLYTSDYDKITNYLDNEYFIEYATKPSVAHVTESDIKKLFEKQIKSKSPELIKEFKKDFSLSTENNEFKFDYAWQNGTLNLVKPISFDLIETKRIQEKSIYLYGNLSLLSEVSKKQNCRFDLIIAKPQEKSAFNSFDKALKTIDKADVNKEIIFKSEIYSYTQKVLHYITSHQ